MAGGADCRNDGEVVPVTLDAGMLAALDSYCRHVEMADRGDAINELLMIGLSYAMPDPGRPKP